MFPLFIVKFPYVTIWALLNEVVASKFGKVNVVVLLS